MYFRGKINKEYQNKKTTNRFATKINIIFKDLPNKRKSNEYNMRRGGHAWIDMLKKSYHQGNNSCVDLTFEHDTINTNANWFDNFIAHFTKMLGSNCIVKIKQNGVNRDHNIAMHCWISDIKSESKLEIYHN